MNIRQPDNGKSNPQKTPSRRLKHAPVVVSAAVRGRAILVIAAATLACWAPGAVAKLGPPALAFSPSPYDYRSVTLNQTASQSFTLKNTGGTATSALKLAMSGSPEFTVTSDTCTATSLGPGKSCTVQVQFAASSTGAASASLTAVSNKPAATATDSLSGTGNSAGHVYWTDEGAGTLWRAGLDGSNPTQLESGQYDPAGVAVDASHIYWVDDGAGTIWKADLDGSNPTQLLNARDYPVAVAVDTSHIYWTTGNGTIWKAGLDGSNPTQLESGQSYSTGVAVDASHIYWTWCGACPTTAPIPNNSDGTIWEASLDGSDPTQLESGQNRPAGLAIDASHLYWANAGITSSSGTIWKVGLNGSNPTQLESDQNDPTFLAVGP